MTTRASQRSSEFDPFNFTPFSLHSAYFENEQRKYPSLGYTCFPDKGDYKLTYQMLLHEIGNSNLEPVWGQGNSFQYGYFMLPFNFRNDGQFLEMHAEHGQRESNQLMLNLKFKDEITEPVCVFIMLEYSKTMVMDKNRKISWK